MLLSLLCILSLARILRGAQRQTDWQFFVEADGDVSSVMRRQADSDLHNQTRANLTSSTLLSQAPPQTTNMTSPLVVPLLTTLPAAQATGLPVQAILVTTTLPVAVAPAATTMMQAPVAKVVDGEGHRMSQYTLGLIVLCAAGSLSIAIVTRQLWVLSSRVHEGANEKAQAGEVQRSTSDFEKFPARARGARGAAEARGAVEARSSDEAASRRPRRASRSGSLLLPPSMPDGISPASEPSSPVVPGTSSLPLHSKRRSLSSGAPAHERFVSEDGCDIITETNANAEIWSKARSGGVASAPAHRMTYKERRSLSMSRSPAQSPTPSMQASSDMGVEK